MMLRIILSCSVTIILVACNTKEHGPVALDSPVAPEDAVSTFQIEPGFKIDLIAAEPLIADPVAMEIDEDGNMYVVENHGYPLDKTKSSKVKLLRDTDGDGRMDESTVFADTLLMPTGVMRWKKGIIVTDAPDLLYMEDTTGDGKADIVKRILTGFALSNPQHNVNSPIYGIDNWIYLAHERTVGSEVYKEEFGDQGSEIHFPEQPDKVRLPRNANGRNVRLRPQTFDLEMLSSTTQYGHSFDEWGNYFLINNSNHLMHSVLAAEYLNGNPLSLVSNSTSYIPDHGNAAEVFPITKTPDRQLLTDVGVMTSACGLVAYTGGAFPDEFNTRTTFIAEPVSNIVHADRLKPEGSTFVASRLRQKKEFLASTDMWSRPVQLYVGPDGALYVVDYYREIIEHPEWLSEDVINSGRLYNGSDMGRIFRISATHASPLTWTRDLSLSGESNAHLVQLLSHPNLWWRRTAQRLLVDRKAHSEFAVLSEMVLRHQSPLARLHALWTLEGLGKLTSPLIEAGLRDREPGVRANAIKLAELHLTEGPQLQRALMQLQDDTDAKVRFQLLCTLGFVNSKDAARVRKKLLFTNIKDEYVQSAALSAPSAATPELLDSVLYHYEGDEPAYASLVTTLTATLAVAGHERYAYALMERATAPVPANSLSWHVPVLRGTARAVANRSDAITQTELTHLVSVFFSHPSLPVKEATLEILQASKRIPQKLLADATERARKIAADSAIHERERALAVDFLALQHPLRDVPLLQSLALHDRSMPVRLAAIRTMNAVPDETVTSFTLNHWDAFDPALQDAALNNFMGNESRMKILMEALESGKIQPTSVGWQRSIRLMTQRNVELRNRARSFFSADDRRKKVVEEYRPALDLKGDVAKGRDIYQKNCAICHQVKGKDGIAFGPDLGTIQSWPASGIMENIIDPNQSIAHGYDLWNVVLTSGEAIQGVIVSETSSTLTLRNASGQVRTVARQDVASQKALNMSAMPVGLERNMSHQDMADLLAFLRNEE